MEDRRQQDRAMRVSCYTTNMATMRNLEVIFEIFHSIRVQSIYIHKEVGESERTREAFLSDNIRVDPYRRKIFPHNHDQTCFIGTGLLQLARRAVQPTQQHFKEMLPDS